MIKLFAGASRTSTPTASSTWVLVMAAVAQCTIEDRRGRTQVVKIYGTNVGDPELSCVSLTSWCVALTLVFRAKEHLSDGPTARSLKFRWRTRMVRKAIAYL